MRRAEAISSYTSLPRQEAFDIEYWLLEEAKLQRMPKPKPPTGRIALVPGSAGGIGKAIAKKFADEGSCVVFNDNDVGRLEAAREESHGKHGKDVSTRVESDATQENIIQNALK